MKSPETARPHHGKIAGYIGEAIFKFWHGYGSDVGRQHEFWRSVSPLLKIESKAYDPNWIKQREAELNAMPSTTVSDSEKWIKAYGRARLEEFCRYQGMMPDGRIVTRLPVCGAQREQLADLGILADSFMHENRSESSGNNYTVILPKGWTMRPTDILKVGDQTPVDPLRNERWASVYNDAYSRVIDVFYDSKPYGEGFRSRTRILEQ